MSQLEFNSGSFNEEATWFADIILPLPLPKRFTYRIPRKMEVEPKVGSRVIVQFGKRKIFTGIIAAIHEVPPEGYEAKLILDLLDDQPIITQEQIKLFQWMADYYMCSEGEVLQAALPSGLKLNSESKVQLHPQADLESESLTLSNQEKLMIEVLEAQSLIGFSELSAQLGKKSLHKTIKSLLDKELILIFEQVNEKYTPKKEKRLVLNSDFRTEKKVKYLFDEGLTSSSQEDVLLGYLNFLQKEGRKLEDSQGVDYKKFMTSDFSVSSINTMIKNGILDKFEIVVPRFVIEEKQASVNLSEVQLTASKQILSAFEKKKTVLLHGITGSGKTEIYIDLINKVLESGQQVLYLLPEIALTTQIISRLSKAFGKGFGVFHSRYSDNERVEVWNGVLEGEIRFVVGVRSSVFLPFQDLGLVIVDEEHETSYKQYNPAPRYHARDTAIVLGQLFHAPVLLGTATPSMESYFNAINGKYELVSLDSRFGSAQLPEFEIVDMAMERKIGKVKGEFSNRLIQLITENITKSEQTILFQNRRGYAPIVNCEMCDWTSTCIQCSVSLTYHQFKKELKCHYCGYTEPVPKSCPNCSSSQLKTVGFGTQKLEEDINLLLPDSKVQRMDLDTTRSKSSYEQIISSFEKGDIDILIGTQIITKGLDFDSVSLVGIVDLDKMLHFPDFRASEKTFQLSVQVAGRAGRREKTGKVVIQTKQGQNPIVRHIRTNDWLAFFQSELMEREKYNYPPYIRLIKITLKSKDANTVREASEKLSQSLRSALEKKMILGPQEPLINFIRNQHLWDIWVKIHRNDPQLAHIKSVILNSIAQVNSIGGYSGVRVICDVDPY